MRAKYVNPGAWFRQPHYVTINDGNVELKAWQP